MRHEIINNLIRENGFKTYLEIGLGDGKHFANVKCEQKVGVDPMAAGMQSPELNVIVMESDEFFRYDNFKFDLIFIDGLHYADQVERDIVNSWNCLNKGGMILVHDIKPDNEEMTLIPRQTKQWVGDVYRTWYGFRAKYPKVKTDYIEDPHGLGVIYKSRHKVELGFVSDISFQEYMDKEGWR
jgi:hypothetical protein